MTRKTLLQLEMYLLRAFFFFALSDFIFSVDDGKFTQQSLTVCFLNTSFNPHSRPRSWKY